MWHKKKITDKSAQIYKLQQNCNNLEQKLQTTNANVDKKASEIRKKKNEIRVDGQEYELKVNVVKEIRLSLAKRPQYNLAPQMNHQQQNYVQSQPVQHEQQHQAGPLLRENTEQVRSTGQVIPQKLRH